TGVVSTRLVVTLTDQGDATPVPAALGVHCLTLIEYIEADGWTFLSVCGCGDRAPVRQRAKNLPRQARTGWTGRHRQDMQTSLTCTYGTQQNTSPHCPAPWGSSG